MTKLTPAILVALAASLFPVAMTVSPPAGAAVMPLSSQWRSCDGSPLKWVDARGDARATANLSATGSGALSTSIDMATATPDTHYDVRVIQVPRSPMGCAAGAPGVIVGGLQTDAAGVGSTTFQGPIQSGATGAWVIVERPSDSSQTPAEFYSSEFAISF